MKKYQTLWEHEDHKWVVFKKDEEQGPGFQEYVVLKDTKSVLTNPGGLGNFSEVITTLVELSELPTPTKMLVSSLPADWENAIPLWFQVNPELEIVFSEVWSDYMKDFKEYEENFVFMNRKGGTISLSGLNLQVIPAVFMPHPGELHLYDPQAKILFSGSLGTAYSKEAGLFVENWDNHLPLLEKFHKRWLPSTKAKEAWCEEVFKREIDMICPNYGPILRGEQVKQFESWIRQLKIGKIESA